MKKSWILAALLCLGVIGCNKPQLDPDPEPDPDPVVTPEDPAVTEQKNTYKYANIFARNTMHLYYLWNKEVSSALDKWTDTVEPIAKVQAVRYKDSAGNDIDRWTMLTDDFESFYGSVTGNGKTYGFDFELLWMNQMHTSLCALVTFVYPDSPAAAAGLKRGDYIVKVNGKTMTSSNYVSIVYNELLDGDTLTATMADGTTKELTAKEMYENPIIFSKVFKVGSKKVGYLVYTSFTLESGKDLVEVCKDFKKAGVSELILDLRYNGGGFVLAEQALASMLAPEAAVKAGEVLSTEVYNADLTAYYKSRGIDTKTYFTTDFSYKDDDGSVVSFSTDGANIGLDKLYAIVSSGSASASEALLCDLYPYMDITLVGEQTHGKYCSGWMMDAEGFFEDYEEDLGAYEAKQGKRYTKNWGLYVMIGRFADKNGETRCMPNGLTPDVEAVDDAQDGCQLGDPEETMLAEVLKLCGYQTKARSARRPAAPEMDRLDVEPFRPVFGLRILPTPEF